jgi:transglutaminase-like putative cysteine protease
MFGQVDLQWNVPVHRLVTKLAAPAGRKLHFASRNTTLEPAVEKTGGYAVYRWDARDVPGLTLDSNTPGWYDPYPTVQWGEFESWAEVARWAQALYPANAAGSLVRAEVDRIAGETSDPGERLLAALRFVQREIRYLGVEIGMNSHRPSPPEVTMQRRFGDCKDKSLLMVAMLDALGIEARPALVNTFRMRGIADWRPSPGAFNHVLVRASVGGRAYWIDPTRPPQAGTLATLHQPDYGLALVVDSATSALSPMPATVTKKTIHTVLDTSRPAGEAAPYKVITQYEGAGADGVRNRLAQASRQDVEKSNLNFYGQYYSGIAVDVPHAVTDEKPRNIVWMIERYKIPNLWVDSSEAKRKEAVIHVPDIREVLQRPGDTTRTSPLAVSHPVEITQTTEVLLPEGWSIRPSTTKVSDAAFEFERRIERSEPNSIVITDRFRSLADHVPAADTPRYAANLKRARDSTGYVLQDSSAGKSAGGLLQRINWPVALVALGTLAFCIGIAVKLAAYDPPARAIPEGSPQGIGGWLLFPTAGVIVSPIRVLIEFYQGVEIFSAGSWAVLSSAESTAANPLLVPMLLFDLTANVAILVFGILIAVLFFRRRTSTPAVFVGVTLVGIALNAISIGVGSTLPGDDQVITMTDWGRLAATVLVGALWCAYFQVSKRVRATFVVRRHQAVAGTSVEAAAPGMAS